MGSLSDEGVTGRFKKFLQTDEMRPAMVQALQKGVRMDLAVENYYERTKDGKFVMKAEMAEVMGEMFPE
ncbi:MAG: hypothetical protein AAB074_11645 [Planctomycetota bacterium]